MKRKWILLKIILFLGILIFLIIFSNNRYKIRELSKVENSIDYSDGNYFITHEIVDTLLKSTHPDYPHMQIQRVSVKRMEEKLDSIPFVKSAQVYLENNGVLHTKIKQKKPILRVQNGKEQYYITEDSTKIPLCKTFSSKVLMLSGKINPKDYPGLVLLSKYIHNDSLLKNLIIGIKKIKENSFILLVADGNYLLELGDLNNIEEKLRNFEIFHKQYIENTEEMPYKKLNLNYINQIIASK